MQSLQLLSIPFGPFLNLSSATLACCVLFSCCRSNEVLRRTYGKDNRVLHTAKLSQGFKVVSPSRTWQGAGISTGGTKIGVSGSETRMAKLRLSEVEQQSGEQTMSAILNCVCPNCGGPIVVRKNQFGCQGRCGRDWRSVWDDTCSRLKGFRHRTSNRTRGSRIHDAGKFRNSPY